MVDKDLSFRSFADLQSLGALKSQARDNNPQALETVAKQFESLFLNMLMKNMRKANEHLSEGSYFDSNQTRFYRDMLDQQLSLSLSSGKGVGISEILVKQLSQQGSGSQVRATEAARPSADIDSSDIDSSDVERQAFDQAMEATARAAIDVMAANQAGTEGDDGAQAVASNEASGRTATAGTATDSATTAAREQIAAGNALPELRPGDFVQAIQAAERRLLEGRDYLDAEPRTSTANAATGSQASAETGTQPASFEQPQDFIRHIYPLAQSAASRMGVEPEVLVAQAALETGWGRYLPRNADGSSSHNLFGIKADQRWDGGAALVDTLEFRDGIPQREKAAFRAYGSFQESLNDYVDFIRGQQRYQPALEQASDGKAYLQQLQMAGYATDPEYARKISNILTGDVLQTALTHIKEI